MVMRGRPLRATPADFDPAKLRMRIISPPRRGGKASVWRDRSAIPRAPRALSRFGNVDPFCRTLAVPARPEPVAGPRPNAALLFIVMHCYFSLFSLLFARAGTPGESAQSRAAQGEIRRRVQRPHCYCIVINNAAVRERRAGRGCRSGQDAGQHPRPAFGAVYSRCQTARSTRSRQCVSRARRAGPVGPRDRLRKTTSNANLLSTNYVT